MLYEDARNTYKLSGSQIGNHKCEKYAGEFTEFVQAAELSGNSLRYMFLHEWLNAETA